MEVFIYFHSKHISYMYSCTQSSLAVRFLREGLNGSTPKKMILKNSKIHLLCFAKCMVIIIGKELVTELISIWSCSISGRISAWPKNCNQCDFASQLADLKRHIEIHHREKLRQLKTHHLLIGRNRAQEKLQRSGAVKKLRVFLLDCVAITVAHSSIAISPLRWNITKGRSLAFTHCGKGEVCKCSGSNS